VVFVVEFELIVVVVVVEFDENFEHFVAVDVDDVVVEVDTVNWERY
jgi:hypothetical protein